MGAVWSQRRGLGFTETFLEYCGSSYDDCRKTTGEVWYIMVPKMCQYMISPDIPLGCLINIFLEIFIFGLPILCRGYLEPIIHDSHVWHQPVCLLLSQRILTLNTTELSNMFIPTVLLCLWNEWKTRYGH